MHWGSKHRIGSSSNTDNQRKVLVVSSIKSNSIRTGNSSIGSSKALEGSSSRNFNGSDNHSSVLEPSSVNSKDLEGFKTNYNRVFGRDLSNINMIQSKPTIPHPSMSSRYKSNNVENIRFGSLRNNVSSSDMFQANQPKKMSIDPPSSGRQRKIIQRGNKHMGGVGYKCNKNRNALSRGSTLSKNRSNSGVRNTTYLKSHQFLRNNNNSGLQSFHTHVNHTGTSSDSSKKFSQNRKMSINQMKTVNNLEANKSVNKQTSFRQSYTGVNSSSSNIAYNNYSTMHNYSSLTNSSNKPINVSGTKDHLAILQKQKSNNLLVSEPVDGIANTCANQIFEEKLRDMDKNERQRSIDSRAKVINEIQNDVDMEVQEEKANDMEVDQLVKLPQPHHKSPLKYKSDVPLSDDQKLDYFHSVIVPGSMTNMIQEDVKTCEDPLECSEYATEIFTHLKNTELEFIAKPGYMKNQTDINEKMRAILIDWLVEVHLKF